MHSFISFLRSRQFFIHLAIIIAVILILFFSVRKFLSSYTNHGEFVVVPDFRNLHISQLDTFVQKKDVSYQIIDSIYDPKEKPGIVLRQDPESNDRVKHNRKVYLYVTGLVPPGVIMPKLIDRSERQARLIIETYGLKVGKITPKEADCNGCVLSQSIRGVEIEPGKDVKKGSVVDLVVGTKDHIYTAEADSLTTE
jgi:eukaryotic-like serine/threonine-protein kinase